MAAEVRKSITSTDLAKINGFAPLAHVDRVAGIRIHDVGQGDAIAVLDDKRDPVVQIDYGGREGNPFHAPDWAQAVMPMASTRLLMMTHWDEDHWCAARKAEQARRAKWLVPRQITSPRAVQFSTELPRVRCIPETHVARGFHFTTKGGDELWWEKIAHGPAAGAEDEDCNRTGVALSLLRRWSDGSASVILMPGDAPIDRVGHYWQHFNSGVELRGLVAFHHGAGTHWTKATAALLSDWGTRGVPPEIVFSCAKPNAYDHPDDTRYSALLPTARYKRTSDLRSAGKPHLDLLF